MAGGDSSWARSLPRDVSGGLVFGTYAVLGAALASTRLYGLDRSYWHDEVVAVVQFIREGPRAILAGPELSHELFGLLAWGTASIVGESEATLRLWSAVPFVLGAAIVAAWLHVRIGALAGVLFLVLATCSPLLLDISRQARGYGLAFLAMGVLLIAALEANRSNRTRWLVAFFIAGIVGTWTLPQFGMALLATALVLASDPRLRQRAAIGTALSVMALAAWYSPHARGIVDASRIEDGVQIGTLELLVSPFNHVLIPALVWIDGTVIVDSLVWVPLIVITAIVMAASPLLRELRSALVLVTGVAATLGVLWISQAYIVPRYLSFLLVPLFVLLASGAAASLGSITSRWALARSLAAVIAVGLVVVTFVGVAPDVLRYPREAPRDAAAVAHESPLLPVLAYVRNPDGLTFYLDGRATFLSSTAVVDAVCENTEPLVFVTQPFGIPGVRLDCLRGRARLHRFRQYARGGRMDVWIVPPQS